MTMRISEGLLKENFDIDTKDEYGNYKSLASIIDEISLKWNGLNQKEQDDLLKNLGVE